MQTETEINYHMKPILESEVYFHEIRSYGRRYIRIALAVLGVYMAFITAFHFQTDEDSSTYSQTIVVTFSCLFLNIFIAKFPQHSKTVPMLYGFLCINMGAIVWVKKNPTFQMIPSPFMAIIMGMEYQNAVLVVSRWRKNLSNVLIFSTFLAIFYNHYGYLTGDVVGAIIGFLVFNNFVTLFSEQQLKKISELFFHKERATKEKLETTLEIIPSGVVIIDLKDQVVSFSNQEALNMLQVNGISEIKESLSSYFMSEKAASVEGSSTSLQTQETIGDYKFMSLFKFLVSLQFAIKNHKTTDFLFKSKVSKKYFQVKAQLINENSQILTILNDITRIKNLESQQEKIRSMFFASIAHELRTPLNTIIPLTQRIETFVKDEHIKKLIKLIKNTSLFLQSLIEDALDMSRLENGVFQTYEESFDIRRAVNETMEIMDFQITQKKLMFDLNISDRVPQFIKTDKKRIKQILINLVGNALKFTFKGSIQIIIDFYDNVLSTQVNDTGIGIQQENIDKLFKFFGQVQSSKKINRGGMGLGLTISKMILQELKGDISVKSQFQKGSSFIFRIPIISFSGNPQSLLASEQDFFVQQRSQNQIMQKSPRPLNSDRMLMTLEITELEDEDNSPFNKIEQFFSSQTIINRSIQIMDTNAGRANELQLELIPAKMKLLIVDDSPYNLFVLQELLTECIHPDDIKSALNGQDAISKIQDHDNLIGDNRCAFAFVLMDLHMPIMDGFQAIQKLRELERDKELDLSNTKIIAVSAITNAQFAQAQNSVYFDGFMEKPINFEQIQKLLNNELYQ